MRTFVSAVIVSAVSAHMMDQSIFDFTQYVAKFGKSYDTVEEWNLRFAMFAKFDTEVKRHNQTQTTSVHGHNFLSDFTAAEKTRLLGKSNVQPETINQPNPMDTLPQQLPASVNWCAAGYCNPIQDQGNCGSCWAFAAVAAMESSHAVFNGSLYKLSEQQLVSCAGSRWGNLGCNGGDQRNAWTYTETNPLESEANYPYTSGTTGKTGQCASLTFPRIGQVLNYTSGGTETPAMLNAVATVPNSVSIDAGTSYFQSYTSGVLTDAKACGTTMNHAVVAVGYGTDPTAGGYWIVRNSWGTSWGNQGYVNIGQAAYPGVCGINQDVWWCNVAN